MLEKFTIQKRKIPVTVCLNGKNGLTYSKFIIDTGATQTIFDEDYLFSIGYSKKDVFKTEIFKGFGGKTIDVPLIRLKSISCLGLIRRNFKLGYSKFAPEAFYKGILCVDFFLEHKLIIDFKNGIIEIK